MKARFYSAFLSSIATLLLFSATAWLSCNKDKCVTTTCYNSGTCSHGLCSCASGYQGVTCTTESRQKFLGDWQATQLSDTGTAVQYVISIDGGVPVNSVLVKNFNNYFTQPVSGYVSGADSIIFPSQVIDGSTISGTAFYEDSAQVVAIYTITNQSGVKISVSSIWRD